MSDSHSASDFDDLTVDAYTAQLDKNYPEAIRKFNQIISKYPNEGATIIRKLNVVYLGGERIRTQEQVNHWISDLDSAEHLIKSGISKYKLDKYQGLRDLYFLRGFFKSIVDPHHITSRPSLQSAIDDFNKSLEFDSNYQLAINLKAKTFNELNALSKPDSKGCFIATAIYGSYQDPNVIILRKYRDIFLLKSFYGRFIVRVYYMVSPPFAKVIGKIPFIRSLLKNVIFQPIIDYITKG
jgi:tetratricopeptide (TPR) repeat protein